VGHRNGLRHPQLPEPIMVATHYVLSFTAGGLLYHESIVVAEAYAAARGDWDRTIANVTEANLLQSRTVSTTARKLREVRKRLQLLSNHEMSLLSAGSRLDQKLLLWLACCMRYQVLGDFARDVLRSKYLQMELFVGAADVERFLEAKAVWHEELDNLAASTRTKLQTVMMRMLREAEMVNVDGLIISPAISVELTSLLAQRPPEHHQLFPISDFGFWIQEDTNPKGQRGS